MDWKDYKKELLKNPKVRKECEKLQPEFILASSLIEARIKSKMTQEEVAKRAGIPQSTIARAEGLTHGIPKLSTLKKIAHVLGARLVVKLETKPAPEGVARGKAKAA